MNQSIPNLMRAMALLCASLLSATPTVAAMSSSWMTEIYQNRPNTKLNEILIPATHNSATSKMNLWSHREPGLPRVLNLVRPFVLSLSKCQFHSIYQQLIYGIRYFDFRISEKNGRFYLGHGLVSESFDEALHEIKQFTLKHPKEVVLLRVNISYWYKKKFGRIAARAQIENAKKYVKNLLGDHLLDFCHDVTFADFWDNHKSIVIVEEIAPAWSNAKDANTLHQKQTEHLQKYQPNKFNELCLILTPNLDPTMFLKPMFTFHEKCNTLSEFSKPVREAGLDWIDEWLAQGLKINIVSVDFDDLWPFASTLISINERGVNQN